MGNQSVSSDILNKEIDLIQACIARMSQNCFSLKGWFLTIIAALIALLSSTTNKCHICYIVCFFSVCFWYLDAYFLKQECMYRWKYEWVISNRQQGNIDFLYDLRPNRTEMWLLKKNGEVRKEPWVLKIMITKTLFPFYGSVFIIAGILSIVGW